jgi:uncharacterized protein (DUF305 family)
MAPKGYLLVPMRFTRTVFLLAGAGGALTACAGANRPPASPSPQATMGDAAAMERARTDSVRYPYTVADIAFMSGMISHHAQAIAMAKLAPSHNAGDAVKRLAARIINAQSDEIAIMQTWLRDRRQPVPEANPAGMKMTMGGMEHMMLMPGMLTESQMKKLDASRGADFDYQFLTLMIQHHRGAVAMVDELFSHKDSALNELVFKFAADVHVDQTTEIARMTQMLLGMSGAR